MTFAYFPLCLILLFSSVSFASLGGDEASLKNEVDGMHAKRTISDHGKYSLHKISRNGLRVHQFMGTGGKVFALAWQGKTHPDFNLVMGKHLAEFQQALAQAKQSHHGHGPITVDAGNFHLEMGGHAMAVHGRAWMTNEIPGGVDQNELH